MARCPQVHRALLPSADTRPSGKTPKHPRTPSGPCQWGREARGHLHHLLLGFLLRLLLPRAWGVGRCLCCRGDSSPFAQHGKKTRLYQALKSPWLNVRASLLIPLRKEKTPGIPSSGGKYVISDSVHIFQDFSFNLPVSHHLIAMPWPLAHLWGTHKPGAAHGQPQGTGNGAGQRAQVPSTPKAIALQGADPAIQLHPRRKAEHS